MVRRITLILSVGLGVCGVSPPAAERRANAVAADAGGAAGPNGAAPVPTGEAPMRMSLPGGFQVALFPGEPDLMQPIAFDIDDRGRLWVAECFSYPN